MAHDIEGDAAELAEALRMRAAELQSGQAEPLKGVSVRKARERLERGLVVITLAQELYCREYVRAHAPRFD